jgi:hypothetical protein
MGSYDGRLNSVKDKDLMFSENQALPNNTSADSTNKLDLRGSNMFGRVPVILFVDLPTHTIAAEKSLDVEVMTCDTESGTYAEYCRLHFKAGEAIGGRKAVGLINPKSWVKLTYETTDDLDALTVTAFIKPNV